MIVLIMGYKNTMRKMITAGAIKPIIIFLFFFICYALLFLSIKYGGSVVYRPATILCTCLT